MAKEALVQMVGSENATKWINLVKSMIESEMVISVEENQIITPMLTEV